MVCANLDASYKGYKTTVNSSFRLSSILRAGVGILTSLLWIVMYSLIMMLGFF